MFLIALASGFPVTVLTWSGVASVNAAFYDVARTLGARPVFLVFARTRYRPRCRLVFVGLFMLAWQGHLLVLVVAEMMGS